VKIGIVGAGNMGLALAAALKDAGHEIRLSFTRDTAKLEVLATGLGAVATTPAEAIAGADVIVIAVPPAQIDAALAETGPLGDAVIVSISSGLDLDPTGARFGIPTNRETSVAEEIAAKTGSSRVVQSFTLTFADMLAARGKGQTPSLPVVGDDAAAVDIVAALIDQSGYEPLKLGGLRVSRALETLATATAQLAVVGGLAPMLAVKLVR